VKIFRSLPFIASAILGLIFFGLYRTSNFVNKKVADEKTTSMDNLTAIVSNAIDSTNLISSATALTTPMDSTQTQGAKSTSINDICIVELTTPSMDIVAPTLPIVNASGESPATSEKTQATAISNDEKSETKPKKRTNVASPKATTNSQSVQNTEKEVAVRSKGVAEAKIGPKKEGILDDSSVNGNYHVVIGSYGVEANAKADAAKFEKKYNTKAKVIIHKGLYRVSTKNFDSEKGAIDYADKLKIGGTNTLVLKF
jgi:SPOR domain